MSIIRLSCIKDTIYAPRPNGDLVPDAYDKRRRRGRMDRLVKPRIAPASALFRHYLQSEIGRAAAALPAGQPPLVMVNGFLFDPKHAVSPEPGDTDNPHGRIYHFKDTGERNEQRHHTTGWPLWMGFDEVDQAGGSGLAVAFGWHSQPGFASSLIDHFENFYARAYENAGLAAWVLVNVLDELAAALPDRPIDIMAHSLGSRVVVRAIALAARHHPDLTERIGRVVFLGGAEYVVEAQLMTSRLHDLNRPRRPDFYNIVSRENDVLDKLGENFGPRTFGNSQVIGHNGLDLSERAVKTVPNWIDLQIDGERLQDWMQEQRGIQVSGDRPNNIWDHWYYYTFRGNMDLYRGILRDRPLWDILAMRAAENPIPEGVPKRWYNFGD
jgi:pimeloyl-ACP methyl ester carboxylesterase